MTILGSHTVEEVKQFIAAQQSEVDDLSNAWNNNGQVWQGTDANAANLWKQDFDTWRSQWDDAVIKELGVDAAEGSIMSAAILGPLTAIASLDDVTPDETGYNNMLTANYWPGGLDTIVDGNINGLSERLTNAIGNFPRATPPAENAVDIDSAIISSGPATTSTAIVDTAIKAGNAVANAVPKTSTIGLYLAGAAGIALTAIGLAYTVPAVATHAVGKRIRKHLES